MDLSKLLDDIKNEYRYKVELHAHTKPVSPCSSYRARNMAKKYGEMGYAALAITNHFQTSMLARSEDDAVNFFMQDFLDAKDEGEKYGLKVCLGIEARFADLHNDYLIYGVEEKDVRQLYNYVGGDGKTYYDQCKNERNFIVQAHPFRNGLVYTPDRVDGVEGFNLNRGHNSRISPAVRGALTDRKIQTAGSDLHHAGLEELAYIRTRKIPNDSFELADILRDGDFVIAVGDDIILQPNLSI